RAIASRIALERGWTLGREVGWQVRFERRFSSETRLLVVTEGILTARLQTDPLLSDFRTVVLDEFHERSIHADLALALARQAWRARRTSPARPGTFSTACRVWRCCRSTDRSTPTPRISPCGPRRAAASSSRRTSPRRRSRCRA